jgi:hypothetical protein
MQNKGVTLSIFHNGRGGYFKKKLQQIQWLLSEMMIRVHQIKGQMFLIIVRISWIYFFSNVSGES